MIGLDTNVLVRYLVEDDEAQSAVASKLIDGLTQSDPGFISSVVLAEISWVLSTSYKLGREEIASVIEELILSRDLVFENIEACYLALYVYRSSTSVDFADALIAQTAKLAGARETVTFDRKAARESGMRLLSST
ncbi:MAG: type II toxin-antitoxin system VapC family toxin [Bacteroidota bacterium]|nr:type II toxin-antitoxin system VapC family toxin [Bacteroidota bacterium]MXW13313.1 type II toxin-antitoxin system VapC family toxin [Rhodothermaceae bacterium]MDE2644583.1 type II toxin-antitoxin system VapC family toxin [Bacteroidota bacterium]MXW32898.1 type II toxin-antitoxin system VapC family toxin [Rhodothermaceae bacterium]MYC03936.1 type II toxin-antitoxin system VapC family toxin [Rhodothermaceae bacterium]